MPLNRTTRSGGQPSSPATNLIAGGGAGMMDALICFPLDTVKVRMQLSKRASGAKTQGMIGTAIDIARRENFLGFYRGLGAVTAGIIPKIAIRFAAYDYYRQLLAGSDSKAMTTVTSNFVAGLAAGVTEAVAVVTPMELVKIRMQAQTHPNHTGPKYRHASHALYSILKNEGPGALWRGVSFTAIRQGTNTAANFAVYAPLKAMAEANRPDQSVPLPSYQVAFIGLIAGAVGPLCNTPVDTLKTRMQRAPTEAERGMSSLRRAATIISTLYKQEGLGALWSGTLPRVMRVAPGQAVTFAAYEIIRARLESMG